MVGVRGLNELTGDLDVVTLDALYDEPAPVEMVRASVSMPTLSRAGLIAEPLEDVVRATSVVPVLMTGGAQPVRIDLEEARAVGVEPRIELEEHNVLPNTMERVRTASSVSDIQDTRDPFLPCRLRMYVFEGIIGCTVSTIQCILVSKRCFLMSHIGYLMVPFSVTAIRTSWAIYTLLDYNFSSSHFGSFPPETEPDSQMMVIQLRMLWQCSVWIFPSMSAVLSVWYVFGASLAVAAVYVPSEKDSFTFMFVIVSIFMFLVNAMLMSEGFWASRQRRYVTSPISEDDAQTPAVKILVTNIPVLKYGDLKIESSNESHATCLICLEDFEASHRVSKLNCGHIFHEECAREWLNLHLRCPLRCKRSISAPGSQVRVALSSTAVGFGAFRMPRLTSI